MLFLGKPDNVINDIYTSTLAILLYGYDETNPIYICVNDKHTYNYKFNTVLDIDTPENTSDIVFQYMQDITKVIRKPYEISETFNKDNFYDKYINNCFPNDLLLSIIDNSTYSPTKQQSPLLKLCSRCNKKTQKCKKTINTSK